jgi:hypothetical protein
MAKRVSSPMASVDNAASQVSIGGLEASSPEISFWISQWPF